MDSLVPCEVYAVRYAHHERSASENFLGGDPHNAPTPLPLWPVQDPQDTLGDERARS